MLSQTLALTIGATLLVAAGAASSQNLASPFVSRNASGFSDGSSSARFGHRGRDGRQFLPDRWHRRAELGSFYGAGLPNDAYDGSRLGEEQPSAVMVPQTPAPGPAQVDVRVHPTYSELPYYPRTAGPSVQRLVKTKHGVHVVTTTFDPPIQHDVPLTARP